MNLFDLVIRGDRSVVVEGLAPVAELIATSKGHQRAVSMAPGSQVRIVDAQELTALAVLSADLGWSLLSRGDVHGTLTVTLCTTKPQQAQVPVSVRQSRRDDGTIELRLDWPREIVLARAFDIELAVAGDVPVTLLVGPLVNMRERLLPLARGVGVEVGPGLRPHVLPADGVDVTYVEQQDPRDWLNLYNKTGDKPDMPPQHILDRYVRSSAVALDGFKPESLDFIFSNHVFEHLPNPLQVLRNWLGATRPGGLIMGVVPDPRFTFDCRQPPTTTLEAMHEEAVGGHEIGLAKYQRWCRHTEPRHTPEDLIQRNYSIHVNFFTPATLRDTMALLEQRGLVDRVFVFTAPNHKDFAFVLRKSHADD